MTTYLLTACKYALIVHIAQELHNGENEGEEKKLFNAKGLQDESDDAMS